MKIKFEDTPIAKKYNEVGERFHDWRIPEPGESIDGSYNPIESYNAFINDSTKKIVASKRLTLCDPITQICERIKGFFRGCSGITVSYCVNNSRSLDWKKDENGEYIVGKKIIGDNIERSVFYSEDHISELRLYVQDQLKAESLANVIRHRHVVNEEFDMASPIDGSDAVGTRAHILNVRVMTLNDMDPMENGNPYTTEDDDTSKALSEVYGIVPIKWNNMEEYGAVERLSPSGINEDEESYPDIPRGAPEEYEQQLWEIGFQGTDIDGTPVSVSPEQASKWKWKWLREALRDNPNITDMSLELSDGMNTWRFIECSRFPVAFQEDNLTSARGFNSILPADLLPLVFAVFGKYCISTYARQSMLK